MKMAVLLTILMPVLMALGDDSLVPHFEKIIGGQFSTDGVYPYQVAIRTHKTGPILCGGVIISERHILTAAHCVLDNHGNDILGNKVAVAGQTHLMTNTHRQIRKMIRYCCHPGYNPKGLRNDIAVIWVANNFIFNGYVGKAIIDYGVIPPGVPCATSGWGAIDNKNTQSNALKYVRLPVVDGETCRRQYGNDFNDTLQLCMHGGTTSDFCSGDSGGPLVYNNYVVGIVSYNSDECASSVYCSVFTRLAPYADWIHSAQESFSFCLSSAPVVSRTSMLWIAILVTAITLSSKSV